MVSKIKVGKIQQEKTDGIQSYLANNFDRLKDFFVSVEAARKQSVQSLSWAMLKAEKSQNLVIQTRQGSKMMGAENDLMRERLGRLFNALQSIGEVKIQQDRYESLIEKTRQQELELREEMQHILAANLSSLS